MHIGVQLLNETDLNAVSTVKTAVLGSVGQTRDGRRFRFVQAGAALSAGQLVAAAAAVANHQNIAPAATAVGESTITVTLGATAAAKDDYADGLLIVNSGAGLGQQFRIIGNTAGSASGTVQVKIEGQVKTALTTGSRVRLVPNVHKGVTTTSTIATKFVGVTTVAIASGSYGWVQTHGPAGVLIQGTAVANGDPVIPSATTAGAVEGIGTLAVTDQVVGHALIAGTTAEYSQVYLTIG